MAAGGTSSDPLRRRTQRPPAWFSLVPVLGRKQKRPQFARVLGVEQATAWRCICTLWTTTPAESASATVASSSQTRRLGNATSSTAGCRRGRRTNQTPCTNLTTAVFADLVTAAQSARAGPPRLKRLSPESSPCRKRTKVETRDGLCDGLAHKREPGAEPCLRRAARSPRPAGTGRRRRVCPEAALPSQPKAPARLALVRGRRCLARHGGATGSGWKRAAQRVSGRGFCRRDQPASASPCLGYAPTLPTRGAVSWRWRRAAGSRLRVQADIRVVGCVVPRFDRGTGRPGVPGRRPLIGNRTGRVLRDTWMRTGSESCLLQAYRPDGFPPVARPLQVRL